MKKYSFISAVTCLLFQIGIMCAYGQTTQMAAGVTKISTGEIDQFTPYGFCSEPPAKAALDKLPSGKLPFNMADIRISINKRGVVVEVPLDPSEQLYGFGLQIGSFNQRGLKKRPIVNDNPLNDLGYTHGPATFYVSNKGYGILINTARYTTFYCGSTARLTNNNAVSAEVKGGNSVEELYKSDHKASGYVTADIPGAKGIEVFVFEGPDLKNAMQRYNLFGGGGALPAIWGLGVKYRVKADFKQSQVDKMAAYFRDNHIPCDVLGLEPKWQTAAYSCSYVWNKDFFPTPNEFIDSMKHKGFHLNLWEHAFVSPKSPIYKSLKNKAGNYLVWNGLVPDFADTAATSIFANYHQTTFVQPGISGFKMDECDNSNISFGSDTWSFPELSQFPSGIDGEQMHQLFGLLYQKTIYGIYKKLNQRTYLDVRASNAFASSYPAALYSDTYVHEEYIRMILNSGFSGMIWSPEVRESNSIKDFMRRSQTAVLSAQTLYNSWYLQNPPWLQINREKNNKGELMDNAQTVEADIRKLLNFRMSLIPYLYNAFADYHFKGIPPFRALVMDYPDDKNTYNLADEYMIGNSILAAPLTEKQDGRKVYLPQGTWYDFNTNKPYEGGREYTIKPDLTQLPIFIKGGTILPLARPVEYVTPDTRFDITCYVYGKADASATLFEDDGITFNYEKGSYNMLNLIWNKNKGQTKRDGKFKNTRYSIKKWQVIN
ncbi:TIM-barrel domain-containing protein [Mucilaginibacter aquaedulcis]|uniref:glycoside hydrolase family 31 protein n=1 Tax=Mucilaginibacter aquaedulcis TaxID=1187081 RepID=UPI0025B2D68D|nr:TIM-barrel domain-containing protein [Mucilaginibacter aquaedulcis]MDN3551738.1 glycoside hydrolase family 31 protein [Mucilaginibacter aquaedulcis]